MQTIVLMDHIDFVVVAKPPGISVHRDGYNSNQTPLLQLVRDFMGHWVWPIHRIDRQCSGCVLFSKTQENVNELQNALQNGTKRYLALVRGKIQSNHRMVVTNPIKVNKLRNSIKIRLNIVII